MLHTPISKLAYEKRGNRSKYIAIPIIAIVLVALVSAIYIYGKPYSPDSGGESPHAPPYVPPKYVDLQVSANVRSSEWERDTSNDLPVCLVTYGFSIANNGNKDAADVHLSVKLTESSTIIYEANWASLSPGNLVSDSKSYGFSDGAYHLLFIVTCPEDSNQYQLYVDAVLPRSFSINGMTAEQANIVKLYVTPQDPIVRGVVSDILSTGPWIKWIAMRDWVGTHIKYRDDSDVHGTAEYWQLPRETIEFGTGDCEDSAILLCSMLRSIGWSSDDVYVVLGLVKGEGHAWVWLKVINLFGIEVWHRLESTDKGGWLDDIFADFEMRSEYVHFNDIVIRY